jgi:hypothetical protein
MEEESGLTILLAVIVRNTRRTCFADGNETLPPAGEQDDGDAASGSLSITSTRLGSDHWSLRGLWKRMEVSYDRVAWSVISSLVAMSDTNALVLEHPISSKSE